MFLLYSEVYSVWSRESVYHLVSEKVHLAFPVLRGVLCIDV